MVWTQARPPRASSRSQAAKKTGNCFCADRLDHLDRRELRVRALVRRGSPARRSRRGRRGPPRARAARASSACAGESVRPVTRAPYSPAAVSANEPQPQPISSTWSSGPSSSLSQTRRSLRRCASASGSSGALEDRARVGHRLVEHQPEEVVAEVVVVLDVPPRAEQALAAAGARPRLHHAREARAPLDRRLGVPVQQLEQAGEVVGLVHSPAWYDSPSPSSPRVASRRIEARVARSSIRLGRAAAEASARCRPGAARRACPRARPRERARRARGRATRSSTPPRAARDRAGRVRSTVLTASPTPRRARTAACGGTGTRFAPELHAPASGSAPSPASGISG